MTNTEIITKASRLACDAIAAYMTEGNEHYADLVQSLATLGSALEAVHGPSIDADLGNLAATLLRIGTKMVEEGA